MLIGCNRSFELLAMITKECFGCGWERHAHQHLHDCAHEAPSCAGMSHGLAATALSGFLSRLAKCAESQDLRHEPLDVRKATFATVLARAAPGLRLNEHMEEKNGPLLFHHACQLGLETGGFALRFGPLPAVDQEQEPERTCGEAGAEENWWR
jgi:hypothetical protein